MTPTAPGTPAGPPAGPPGRPARSLDRSAGAAAVIGGIYLAHSAYLGVSASPDLFYVAGVLAHLLGGLALTLPLAWMGLRGLRAGRGAARGLGWLGFLLFAASTAAALRLIQLHNTRATAWLLQIHILLGFLAAAVIAGALALGARESRDAARALRALGGGLLAAAVIATALPLAGVAGDGDGQVRNPPVPAFDMAGESMGGADGPFHPSAAHTSTGGRIPSDFFMTSETCARCHGDIYRQWRGSAHHFSSFNNQWYRKSIEYMQEVGAVEASKWCAGCHDHAVLLNGMMEEPVEAFLDTPEAHTGLGCNSCHAITGVHGTLGNGGFRIEVPPLHDLAASEDPWVRWLHDFVVRIDPGPHRRVFLKPFHREQTAEFCSSCHKVHLDEPVNRYRWLRGFNEYDNWQASGVSGQGARSFYYPPRPMDCGDCHMPLTPSADDGNLDGRVHDHSFAAANTAVPRANLDEEQLRRTIEFLQAGQVTVDIFAAGPARPLEPARPPEAPRLASTFAVGEEEAMAVGRPGGAPSRREPAPVWAPLDRSPPPVRRGEEVRVDVVVRTRNVGHFFPGGTVDAFDVWLELRATDETGDVLFWSGVARDGGAGPVDRGAHFYGSRMVDHRGNPIDKRNAFAARTAAWINLIPPGAADVAHFRLRVPADAGERLTLEARLNYRKFSHFYTGFSFGGRPAPGEPLGPGPGVERVSRRHDDRRWIVADVPADVSAEVREVPALPIVVVARRQVTLPVAGPDEELSRAGAEPVLADAGRWNDYGIGLLRQGDLKGARRAFLQVTGLRPAYADGWVNLARVALAEGLLDDAAAALEEALRRDPDLASAHYFLGVARKERGDYDAALGHLRRAAGRYPRDRVVRNAIGRVLFLQRRYAEAVRELERVIAIDPEDLTAHYNLMLCFRGLGREDRAEEERRLYQRFKADEDAPMILGPYLRQRPEDNRMRQPIHEQVSVPPAVIERESRLRRERGEPLVVLPGEAAAYARRAVERGRRLRDGGRAAARHAGPTGPLPAEPGDPSGGAPR